MPKPNSLGDWEGGYIYNVLYLNNKYFIGAGVLPLQP